MFSLGLYVQGSIMCDALSFVLCVIYVPNLVWSCEWNCPQLHSSGESGTDEIVGGSGVHKYFDVSHEVICSNGHWDLHRSKARDYYRITIDCPYPGQWVQAL